MPSLGIKFSISVSEQLDVAVMPRSIAEAHAAAAVAARALAAAAA